MGDGTVCQGAWTSSEEAWLGQPPLPSLPTSLVLEAAARMAARMLRRAWVVGVGAMRVFSNKTRGTFSQQ